MHLKGFLKLKCYRNSEIFHILKSEVKMVCYVHFHYSSGRIYSSDLYFLIKGCN